MAGKTLGAQVNGGDSSEVAACVCILDNAVPVNTPKYICRFSCAGVLERSIGTLPARSPSPAQPLLIWMIWIPKTTSLDLSITLLG